MNKVKKSRLFAILLVLVIFGLALSLQRLFIRHKTPYHEPFKNGDFEEELTPWHKTYFGMVEITSTSHSGKYSVNLSQGEGLVGIRQNFTPTNATTLSFFCMKTKTDEIGVPTLVIRNSTSEVVKTYDCSNTEWSYVSFDVSDVINIDSIEIMIDGVGGKMEIIYDDVSLS